MQSFTFTYLLFLCGFLDFITGESLLQEILLDTLTNIIKTDKELNDFEFPPMKFLSTPQVIEKDGYPVEVHHVQTEDGYILELHRIPSKNVSSLPVFLQHGISSSSADWVIAGKGIALAYLLADQEYDVWMGNIRGNTYSKAHVSLSPSNSRFWNFSWHEMGIYDLPAMITYVRNTTSQQLHAYIGHSMGTTVSYVMTSERPEIAERVKLFISLAPVAFMEHVKGPLRLSAPFAGNLKLLLHLLGQDELLPQNFLLQFLAGLFCDETSIQRRLCSNIAFLVTGIDNEQFNISLIPTILEHFPAGTSTKTAIHYIQEINPGRFCKYDYGRRENLKYYNTPEPPSYELKNIKAPFALFYAENDWLSGVEDVKKLIGLLPNIVYEELVPYSKFNHWDYLFGKNMVELVYNKILQMLKN
ncbi:hypothetical protein P5V15_004641 [Pogonomyrmex californicus]